MTPGKYVKARLRWDIPSDLATLYANNIVVQHTEDEFILMFFEALPPLLAGTPEEIEEKVQSLNQVEARCVARIVVPAARMGPFIQAMIDNFEKHNESVIDDGEDM